MLINYIFLRTIWNIINFIQLRSVLNFDLSLYIVWYKELKHIYNIMLCSLKLNK